MPALVVPSPTWVVGAVFLAVADDGPAVVVTGQAAVDLVAALVRAGARWTHSSPVAGFECRALRIAVAVAPDRVLVGVDHGGTEGIAGGRRAIGRGARTTPPAITRAVPRQSHAGHPAAARPSSRRAARSRSNTSREPKCAVLFTLGVCLDDHGHAAQRARVRVKRPPVPRPFLVGGGGALGIAEIDAPVARKVGVHRHVEQATLARHVGRQARRSRRRRRPASSHPPAAGVARAAALGDEHAAVREEGQAPGTAEIVDELGELELHRAGRCRRHRLADRATLVVVVPAMVLPSRGRGGRRRAAVAATAAMAERRGHRATTAAIARPSQVACCTSIGSSPLGPASMRRDLRPRLSAVSLLQRLVAHAIGAWRLLRPGAFFLSASYSW